MKRVLVVAGWYPPCDRWPTAARRIAGLVRGLPQHGWSPTVVLPDLTEGLCYCDPCRQGLPPTRYEGVTAVRAAVRPTVARRLLARRAERGPGAAASETAGEPSGPPGRARRLLDDGRAVAWSANGTQTTWGRSAARAGRTVLSTADFHAVLSTSGPFEHVRAARSLARSGSLPWIADLRDPATIDVTAEGRWIEPLVRLARGPAVRALRGASGLISPTQQVVDVDRRDLGEIELLLPGFDSEEWAGARAAGSHPREHLEIAFAGRLYPAYRRPDLFLRGLAAASAQLPDDVVRLVYYGRDGADLLKIAAASGCAHLVEDRGFVSPHVMARRLTSASALLLLTNEAGASGVPGGKFYEYLAAHRPILAVPAGDRFVHAVLDRTGAGFAAGSADEVSSAILRWVAEWRVSGDLEFRGDPHAIEEYSDAGTVRRLSQLLDEATHRWERS